MTLFCTLLSEITHRQEGIPIYVEPDQISEILPHPSMSSISSITTGCLLSHDIQPDDYILCHERDGIWYHCYTRNVSGWILGSYLQPATLPCTFIINDELPSDAQIRLRTKPTDDENSVGSVVHPGTLIYVVEMKGQWLKINYQGKEAWLKREVNDSVILAVPVIPKLYEKGPTLPQGCSLRLRDSPKDDGNVTRLSQSDYYLGVNCFGNYIQVIGHPRSSSSEPEWMLRKTPDGAILLQESKKKPQYMCIQQDIPQDAVLRIRELPESNGVEVGSLTYWDIIPVWSVDGVWAYTLCDLWEGFVLTASGQNKFLQPFKPVYPSVGELRKATSNVKENAVQGIFPE